MDQADDALNYGQETDDVYDVEGYRDGAPKRMLQYHHTGNNTEDAGQELPPPQRSIDEQAYEPESAPDQEVEAQNLNQEDQRGPRCYHKEQAEDGGEDTLQQN